jgi:superfamily II DNA or RNA helicase
LRKSELSPELLASVRKELTVQPTVNTDYGSKAVEAYAVYREDETHICVPRFYGQARFGPAQAAFPALPERAGLQSNIVLRPQQRDVVDATMAQLRSAGGGVLALATGFGKTLICLHIVAQLRLKTLIVVHKTFLMDQWRERIRQFLPHAAVGTIQGPVVDVADKDIVIGMLQSLSMKSYPSDVFDGFGMLACDECHHVAAEVFCRALPKLVVPYTLGLSATVERKDGLTSVIHWFLGDVAYKVDRNDAANRVRVKQVIYHSEDAQYREERRNYRGAVMLPIMLNNIAAHAPRNRAVVQDVVALAQEPGRQVMVLSDRLAHLDELKRLLEDRAPTLTTGYYTGRQKPQELKASERADVIFATRAMSAEGLDIPSLNALVFATPAGDVVQACGRILRKPHAVPATIVDVVDGFSVFYGQARKRKAFYQKAGYAIACEHCDDAGARWAAPAVPDEPVLPDLSRCVIDTDSD